MRECMYVCVRRRENSAILHGRNTRTQATGSIGWMTACLANLNNMTRHYLSHRLGDV